MILNRRIKRNLKKDFFRNLALFLLIALGMYFVVSFVGSAETIMDGIGYYQNKNQMADGEFSLYKPLSDEQISELEVEQVELQEQFYSNYKVGDSALRIFRVRDKFNLIQLSDGDMPETDSQIVLEQHYAKNNNISIGGVITVGGHEFEVVGTGSTADYEKVLENISDMNVDSKLFGIGFVTEAGYQLLKETGAANEAECISYAFKNGEVLDNADLIEWLKNSDDNILLSFVEKENNSRIGNAVEDVSMNKEGGILGGILLFLIFVYVISVFTVHRIEQEGIMIGTLYALGMSKREVIFHYMLLPFMITFLGGIFGTILGFSPIGIDVQAASTIESYSLPPMDTQYPLYLIAYGLLVPSIIFLIVNFICLNSKLSKEPLILLRNQKKRKSSQLKLGAMSFSGKFQLRKMIREKRSILAILGGLFLTVLLLMMALDIQAGLTYMKGRVALDTKYEKMYVLLDMPEDVPEDVELAYIKTFSSVTPEEENLNVSMMGIKSGNTYFDFETGDEEDAITISDSVALKYHLKIGDELALDDKSEDTCYAFRVNAIVPYAPGLYVFMDLDVMRQLFYNESDYYNVILSDEEVDLERGLVYSESDKDDMIKFADVFYKNMSPMIMSLYVVSILIFLIVMYLMLKVMLDRSDFSIALFRVFGYQNSEIRRLFLDGNFVVVMVSSLLIIPLCKYLMDKLWPSLVSYVPMGLDVTFKPYYYIIVLALIVISYLIIILILMQRLKKTEDDVVSVLKERE